MGLGRRSFLKLGLSGMGALLFASNVFGEISTFFDPVDVENPLAFYPNRGWEKVFKDLWRYDSEFSFLCAPNDTHNCLLKAHVKNNVVVRLAPSFGYSKATDLDGNQASCRWEPRCCQKGLALVRRIYGDRRIKYPVIREGFSKWVKGGFPRDENGKPPSKYLEGRGKEAFIKISWDEAFDITARALENIARTYSGEEGKRKLLEQGYDPLMVEATGGAGVQTLKFRGGMPALGATRIFAQYRLANMLALLDSKIRNVEPDKAKGARGWDNYSWHTDLPPGHPMVTGQQTVDFDLSAAEHAGLIIVWGMNWIATKMPDSHWLTEARLKGTKVVVVSVEYSATAPKADEVIIIRPGTDPAFALGLAQVLISERRSDEAFVKRFTDLPFLVRLDTLKLLRASDVLPGYRPADLTNFTTVLRPGAAAPSGPLQDKQLVPEALRNEWGDFLVWDTKSGAPKP